MGNWKVEGVRTKSEEIFMCLDWNMLDLMCEKKLLKFVSVVMIVRRF